MVAQNEFRQTDLGLIPRDWEISTIGKMGRFSKGSGVKKDEALSGEIPCIRYGEIYTRHNNYIKYFYSFISSDIAETAKKLKKGDILFAGSGETKEEIGKCVAFVSDFEAYADGDIVILSPFNSDPLFLGYLLNAPFIQKQKASRGQGDAVVHISAAQLGSISIPLPPLPEQTAIATALSDMDALIAQTEKLIEKKKAIKQGVMQELLRPKEGWEKKKISEAFNIFKGRGLSKNKISEYGEHSCILYGELFTTYAEEITEIFSKTNYSEAVNSVEGDILFPGSTTTTGADLAKASAIFKNGVQLGGDIIILRKYDFNLDSLFVTNFLNYYRKNEIAQLTKGITIHHLYGKDLSGIEIEFPNQSIQMSISNASRDFDLEISSLQKKLQKLIFEKQGMMQALLTGKIRLV